jgi:hypothetical protein
MALDQQVPDLFPVQWSGMNAQRKPSLFADIGSGKEPRIFQEELLMSLLHQEAQTPLRFVLFEHGKGFSADSEGRVSPTQTLTGIRQGLTDTSDSIENSFRLRHKDVTSSAVSGQEPRRNVLMELKTSCGISTQGA